MELGQIKKEETPVVAAGIGASADTISPTPNGVKAEPIGDSTTITSVNGTTPASARGSEPPQPTPKRQKVSEEPELPAGPTYEIVGGSSVRQYLNKHLTQHLLEGLKQVSAEKPEDPLKWLGEYLLEKLQQLSQQ